MSYSAHEWENGEVVTAEKLNQLENGVAAAAETTDDKMPIVTYGEPSDLVNTTTVSFSKDGSNSWYVSAADQISGMSFETNKVYTVTWDGTDYDCYCFAADRIRNDNNATFTCFVVGNSSVFGQDNPYASDAPFAIVKQFNNGETNNVRIVTSSTSASHTVKVAAKTFNAVVLDKQQYESISNGRQLGFLGSGLNSAVFNRGAIASGENSAVFGTGTHATNYACMAIGSGTKATGPAAFAHGMYTLASNYGSHAEGYQAKASGIYDHAEGYSTISSGYGTHAEGTTTTASGNWAHAEGNGTVASGANTHAEGKKTIANHASQHALGEFNVADTSSAAATARGNYVEIVGNGTADDARSNARTLDWDGNEVLAGGLTVDGTGGITIGSTTLTETQLIALLAMLD